MKYALLIVALVTLATPSFCADNAAAQDKKKVAALADFDSKIKANTNRVNSLTKQLDKMKSQIAVVQKAADKLAAAEKGVDTAKEQMEATGRPANNVNGQTYMIYDDKAIKAYEDAQKAFNQAKRDFRGVDEQLAALKAQEATLQKQLDATNDKLKDLQDGRAQLAEQSTEPEKKPDENVDALGEKPADEK